jgi:RND family efflux transporter MFP subunit
MERHPARTSLRPRHRLVAALAVAGGLLALTGCSPEPAAPPALEETAPLPVAVATAAYGGLARTVTATGTVEASRSVRPGTKILGRVDAVPVEEGQRVAAGQLLARLESRDLEASMRQARAAVASAEAQLENARAQYERMTELVGRGSATRKNLEDATSAFHMAEAGLEQAQANVSAASVALGYAEVRSPFDGWLVEKGIEEGDMVQPGAPLFTVDDLDPVKVVADVPETDAQGFAPGAPAGIEVPSVGFRADGVLDRIVPSADRGSRTFRFEIVQPNPDGVLKSGMFARVALARAGAGEASRQALLVPRSALAQRGQLEGLFVVDASGDPPRARLRWVRLGEELGERVEVLSGLSEGERYVVDPPAGLVDGSPVRVAPQGAAPAGAGAGR